MSVLPIPVRVTRTLIAPTVTVLIAVLVNKDSMEMGKLVKVCGYITDNNQLFFINYLK